jgi:hypothetical protein
MISITGKKGFQIAMSNGITVSVQFGPGNYCEMRKADFAAPEETNNWNSQTAEVAAFVTDSGNMDRHWVDVDGFGGDDVSGWNDADRVAEFISKVAAM